MLGRVAGRSSTIVSSVSAQQGSALEGIRVIDASTLIAGPLASMLLGDLGADVIKLEHPEHGDALREHGPSKDGVGLWWTALARNKRAITLYLGDEAGRDVFLRLVATADVVIENFRPGTFERWGLPFAVLERANPKVVLARVTGFGQRGPMATQPGFGTIAESLSGFAFRNGYPDGPPTLPPFGLADTVAGMAAAVAILAALQARERSGKGQEIDVAIIEPLLTVLMPQEIVFDQLGRILGRMGNRSAANAPRNNYEAEDGRWVAISASTQSTAERLLHLIGRDDVVAQPWFRTAAGRLAHVDELDGIVGTWVATLPSAEVVRACAEVGAPAARIASTADIFEDEQYAALGSIAEVTHPTLGTVRMANTPFRMSRTPPRIRWAGPEKGQHNDEVYKEIGLSGDDLARLRARGAI